MKGLNSIAKFQLNISINTAYSKTISLFSVHYTRMPLFSIPLVRGFSGRMCSVLQVSKSGNSDLLSRSTSSNFDPGLYLAKRDGGYCSPTRLPNILNDVRLERMNFKMWVERKLKEEILKRQIKFFPQMKNKISVQFKNNNSKKFINN